MLKILETPLFVNIQVLDMHYLTRSVNEMTESSHTSVGVKTCTNKKTVTKKVSVSKQQLEKNKCRAIAPTCSVLSEVSKALKQEQQPGTQSTLQQNSAWLCMAGCFCQDHTIVIWYDSHCRHKCKSEQVGFNSNRNGDNPVEIVSKNEIIKKVNQLLKHFSHTFTVPGNAFD